MIMNCQLKQCFAKTNQNTFSYKGTLGKIIALNKLMCFNLLLRSLKVLGCLCVIVGNPNRKKMHIFGFVGIFEYIFRPLLT